VEIFIVTNLYGLINKTFKQIMKILHCTQISEFYNSALIGVCFPEI